MKTNHLNLWKLLDAYVAVACEGREPSHGLEHMRLVTEHAIALDLMTAAQQLCKEIVEVVVPADETDGSNTMLASLEKSSADVFPISLVAVLRALLGNAPLTKDLLSAFVDTKLGRNGGDAPLFTADSTLKKAYNDLITVLLATDIYNRTTNSTQPLLRGLLSFVLLVKVYEDARRVPKMTEHMKSVAELDDRTKITEVDAVFGAAFELLDGRGDSAFNERLAAFNTNLARCIVIGMLHDVNDHKYEKPDGSLSKGLQLFVEETLCVEGGEFVPLLFPAVNGKTISAAERSEAIMKAVSAISFSKEKKQGMRYFVPILGPQWTLVRDLVSDADKLEAIGESGLLRCWHYNLEVFENKNGGKEGFKNLLADSEKKEALRQSNFIDVDTHVDEKLGILKDVFIGTDAGKRLAGKAHDEMMALLSVWKRDGPPHL